MKEYEVSITKDKEYKGILIFIENEFIELIKYKKNKNSNVRNFTRKNIKKEITKEMEKEFLISSLEVLELSKKIKTIEYFPFDKKEIFESIENMKNKIKKELM